MNRRRLLQTASLAPLVPPGQCGALARARRVGLPPERVRFAPRETDSRTVPRHLLLNPAGRTPWRWIGVLAVVEMVYTAVGCCRGLRQPSLRRLPLR